jgi:hypothetical protein
VKGTSVHFSKVKQIIPTLSKMEVLFAICLPHHPCELTIRLFKYDRKLTIQYIYWEARWIVELPTETAQVIEDGSTGSVGHVIAWIVTRAVQSNTAVVCNFQHCLLLRVLVGNSFGNKGKVSLMHCTIAPSFSSLPRTTLSSPILYICLSLLATSSNEPLSDIVVQTLYKSTFRTHHHCVHHVLFLKLDIQLLTVYALSPSPPDSNIIEHHLQWLQPLPASLKSLRPSSNVHRAFAVPLPLALRRL